MELIVTLLLWTAAALFVLLGMVGLVLPVLPGPVLLFVGFVLGAWAEGFRHVGWLPLGLLGAMMMVALVIDQLAAAFGVKGVGASRLAALGALVGAIIGLFFGLVGILLGPFLGAFLGELYHKDTLRSAGRAGLGAWLGFFLGTVAKVAIGVTMIGTFVLFRIF